MESCSSKRPTDDENVDDDDEVDGEFSGSGDVAGAAAAAGTAKGVKRGGGSSSGEKKAAAGATTKVVWEPTRRIRNARRKLIGRNPMDIMIDDLSQVIKMGFSMLTVFSLLSPFFSYFSSHSRKQR